MEDKSPEIELTYQYAFSSGRVNAKKLENISCNICTHMAADQCVLEDARHDCFCA